MGTINHSDLTKIYQEDWRDPSIHVIGNQPDISIVRSSTYVVAANDSATHAKAEADYVCDGTADNVEINAALTAAGGGKVFLHKGTYNTIAAISISSSDALLEGAGFDTVIKPASAVTNSLSLAGWYSRVRDLTIDGNGLATQCLMQGAYSGFDHVYFTGHTTYNLSVSSGSCTHARDCWFYGLPAKSTSNAITYENCNFNPNLLNECLIVDGVNIRILNSTFESYKTYAIKAANNTTSTSISIIDNYFETVESVSYTIYTAGKGCYNTRIMGNYDAKAGATGSVYLYSTSNALIDANFFKSPVVVDTSCLGVRARETQGTISYNGLTGLTALDVDYNNIKTIYGTAAPGAGTWARGDRVRNTAPSAGGTTGWVCTTAGTQGTWKAEANLAA